VVVERDAPGANAVPARQVEIRRHGLVRKFLIGDDHQDVGLVGHDSVSIEDLAAGFAIQLSRGQRHTGPGIEPGPKVICPNAALSGDDATGDDKPPPSPPDHINRPTTPAAAARSDRGLQRRRPIDHDLDRVTVGARRSPLNAESATTGTG
jgi:hypothetical protein